MEKTSRISDAEWEVMKIIWNNPYCTSGKVLEELKGSQEWNPKTVRTLIKRLVDKQIIACEISGREYKYYPLVKEEECVKQESRSFLNRVYRGSLKTMLLNFIDEESLSKEDIEELKGILNKRSK